jgi:GT2 family glycosyltransferase
VNVRGETVRQVRRFPKLFDQLMITWKIPHFFPGILNSYLLPDFDYSRVSQVDSIRGAFFLINLKNYQKISRQPKPKLDERYFLWFEEVDFCRQVIAWQGEVWYTPAASCLDYVGQSFKQLKRGKAQKYFRDSMLKYFKKWESAFSYQILNLSWRFLSLFLK